jgi:hypothetical protein
MKRFTSFPSALLVFAALAFISTTALAQRPPLECTPPPEAQKQSTPAEMEEARTRYQRGQELYDDGAYEQALIEFDRAYDLAPAYRILFNIGQVAVLLNNYPRAIQALEGYLCEGKGKVPAKRQQAVEKELDSLYGRVAYIEVTTNIEDAEIIVDDLSRGRTPLDKPIMVNAGRHVVIARKAGRIEDRKTVVLAGTDRVALELELLEPAPGQPASPFPVTPPSKDDPGTGPTPGQPTKRADPDTSWVGWVITGTLAAGAVVTGLLALKAGSDLDDLVGTFGTTKQQLDDKESERFALAVTTDVLIGLAVVSAGLSIWWTVAENDESSDTPTARVVVGPGSVGLVGEF